MNTKELLISIISGTLSGLLLYISYNSNWAWLSFICLIPLLLFIFSTSKKWLIILSGITFIFFWVVPLLAFIAEFYSNDNKTFQWSILLIIFIKLISIIPFFLKIKYHYKLILFALFWIAIDISLLKWSLFFPVDLRIPIIVFFTVVFIEIVPFFSFLSKSKLRIISFIGLWLFIEWLWLNWQLKSPFFSIGLPIGNYPKLIQWVSYTGILGLSLWIIIINTLIAYNIHLFILLKKVNKALLFTLCFIIAIPIVISLMLSNKEIQVVKIRDVSIISFSLTTKHKDAQLKSKQYIMSDSTNMDYTIFPEGVFSLVNQLPHRNKTIKKLLKAINKKHNVNNYIICSDLKSWRNRKVC